MPDLIGINRLPPAPTQALEREHVVRFLFDGRAYKAYAGDTIASALAAAGVQTFSRSFKYHRRRGLLCLSGDCPNCMVQVDDEPNTRACQRRVGEGMRVRSQNTWPSLGLDAMAAAQWFERFLPPGFYYKSLMRPRWMGPIYEEVLRRAAGLGRAPSGSPAPPDFDERNMHSDVLVIGGGPAGLAAADAAGASGAAVILLDRAVDFGGHLRYRGGQVAGQPAQAYGERLLERVRSHKNVTLLNETLAFGWYDGRRIAAVKGRQLIKLQPRCVVVATGARERMLGFPNNDLPGIMLSAAAQRLIRTYRVRPGRRALVLCANSYGVQAALDLHATGAEVIAAGAEAAGLDQSAQEELQVRGIQVLPGTRLHRALGGRRLEGIMLGNPGGGRQQRVDCDLLALATPLWPVDSLPLQAGGRLEWEGDLRRFLVSKLPSGAYIVGGARGLFDAEAAEADGHWAGLQAAAESGHRHHPSPRRGHPEGRAAPQGLWDRPSVSNGVGGERDDGKREFVCLCEDVTRADIRFALREGYESMELLKRYSTVGMGPCQGKMCAHLVAAVVADARGATLAETGRTTARPPERPVKLGALRGRSMNPVRETPAGAWHAENGAKMIVAGLWMRPEDYGDAQAEARAVRERVGLIDVSTLGKILVHGPDAPALLERLYTNRWRGLQIGRVRYGVMLNEEGVVMDDGVTARLGDELYYMTTTSGGSAQVYEWIQWWLQSGWDLEVHALQATDLRAAMNLTGPDARRTLSKLVEGVDLAPTAFPYMHVRQGMVAGVPAILLRIGFTGELGYEIHVPAGYGLHVWSSLLAAGREFGIQPFGLEAQRILRLEKGHIIVGQDTDSLSDPLSAGLGWAVKMEKEAFLGKRSLEKLGAEAGRERLVGFEAEGERAPEEGDPVVRAGEGPIGLRAIGRVTSARYSPRLGRVIGMAWVPQGLSGAGTRFQIRTHGKVQSARVAEVPFFDPQGERARA